MDVADWEGEAKLVGEDGADTSTAINKRCALHINSVGQACIGTCMHVLSKLYRLTLRVTLKIHV